MGCATLAEPLAAKADSTSLTGTLLPPAPPAYARRMRARVPQDVDLEDKLIYGLTPIRFGYLVIAGLGTICIWRLGFLPPAVRLLPCLFSAGAGLLLAFGRWRGRPCDRFLADAVLFFRRNYRVQWGAGRRRLEAPPLALGGVKAAAAGRARGEPAVSS